jgi:hypothetical protein
MARYNTSRCGGYASYSGHCGASDCETCHPGGARAEALEEATAELRDGIQYAESELETLTLKLEDLTEDDADEARVLRTQIEALETTLIDLQDRLASEEAGFDGEDDYDPPDRDDSRDGEGEVDWESPY